MIVSLNEIEATLRKVGLGTGWPFGLAEETGRAAAWLAARGFDGVGAALAALRCDPAPAMAERTGEGWTIPRARAAAAGPSAFDLLATDAEGARMLLRQSDQPLLLVGLAAVAAEAYGGGYDLVFSGGGRAEVSADAAVLSGPIPGPGADVVATRGAGPCATVAASPGGVEVEDRLWRRALAMAARSYVPSSDSSRARGAGAGLIDND